MLGRERSWDDRKVVGNLGIVEDAFVRADPLVGENLFDVWLVRFVEFLHRGGNRAQIIFGQRARVGPRISQHLVLLIQCLRDRQRGFRREPEARVAVALQTGQIVEQRRELGRSPAFFLHHAGLALAFRAYRVGAPGFPQALSPDIDIFRLLVLAEFFVEPAPAIFAGFAREGCVNLEVITRHELLDLLLALDQDGERRRLHAADGRQMESPRFGIERRHRARRIDADKPVGLGAANRGVRQREHFPVTAQLAETLADGRRSHRLQPQAFNRLGGFGVIHDVAKNQLAFAPGVARVEECRHVFLLDQPGQELQPILGSFDRLKIKMLRNNRQVGERPFPTLDLDAFGRDDRQQVADSG